MDPKLRILLMAFRSGLLIVLAGLEEFLGVGRSRSSRREKRRDGGMRGG